MQPACSERRWPLRCLAVMRATRSRSQAGAQARRGERRVTSQARDGCWRCELRDEAGTRERARGWGCTRHCRPCHLLPAPLSAQPKAPGARGQWFLGGSLPLPVRLCSQPREGRLGLHFVVLPRQPGCCCCRPRWGRWRWPRPRQPKVFQALRPDCVTVFAVQFPNVAWERQEN